MDNRNRRVSEPKRLPLPFDSPDRFKSLSDEETVEEFANRFRDTLDRLTDADMTAERSSNPTIGSDKDGKTPSQRIYGKDYPEVNRTCVSVLCLKWLISRDYDSFTSTQPSAIRLSRKSFEQLCDIVQQLLTTSGPQALTALVVAIVVGDVGKNKSFREELCERLERPDLADAVNHDVMLYKAATIGMLRPISILRDDYKQDVIEGLKFGSKLNIAQLVQAENVPGNLQYVQTLGGKERVFLLKYLEVVLDVCGAAGHFDSRSAYSMTEPVFQGFTWCRSALEDLKDGKVGLRSAYDQVLTKRGKLLQAKGVKHLDVNIPRDRALLRLMATARTADPVKAELIMEAFDTMRNTTRQRLIEGLSVDGVDDGEAILLYYIPAVFSEAFKAIQNCSRPKKIDGLKCVMRFMVRAYGNSKPSPGRPGKVVERVVEFAVHAIRDGSFATDPSSVLDEIQLPWEDSHHDHVLGNGEEKAPFDELLGAQPKT